MNTRLFFTSVTFALPLITTTAAAWDWMGTPSVPTRWPNSIQVNGLDYAQYRAISGLPHQQRLTILLEAF